MRPIQRLATKGLSLSSIGLSWSQPSSWAHDGLIGQLSPLVGDKESIESNFGAYVQRGYKANGIVFACILVRLQVFSQARLLYQELVSGKPGNLDHDESLRLLEEPWPNGTTVELLTRMEQDASLAGNFYATPVGPPANRRLRRMRPDWVTIVTGSPNDDPYDLAAEVIGYLYQPPIGPRFSKPVLLTVDQVAHWSPIPDPSAQWRGMSWLTPVLREIEADSAATKHKLKFFQNGATANFVVTYDAGVDKDTFKAFIELFQEQHGGVDNAYKTIHLGGGADVKTTGFDLRQLDFKATQGAGESRIAAASGVGPIVAQFSEGMQGSSLNAGNYGAARRRFGDITMQHSWMSAAASLAKLVPVPAGKRLWFDGSDIPFLQEDQRDAAAIEQIKSVSIKQLVEAGFDPLSVVAAVTTQNLKLLEHTGKLSVQLKDPAGVEPGVMDTATATALSQLIASGFVPEAAAAALGVPPIAHAGPPA